MLINLRNALMAGRQLPYDAEVEYLSSSENAGASGVSPVYIDTGVALSSGIKMSVTAAFNSTAYQLMGCYGGQDGRFDIGINNSRVFVTSIGATSTRSTADTNIHEFVLDAPNAMAYIDGAGIATGTFSIDIPGNVILFSRGRGDRTPPLDYTAAYSKVNIKICSCKIWQNGVLVRDFIPVRKGTVGYLYDRVSGKLFGNAGTGDFVLGSDVVPVEWLGCDGGQYIDTKVVATDSHGFRVDIEAAKKAVDVNTRIFGAHQGDVRCGFALYGEPHTDDYFWGWNTATGFRATIPQRFVVSLNYKNDRAAIFNGTTNLSQLGTLGSMTQSVYLLNANYGNAPFANQFVVGKFYGAEITVGSDVANHYIPVRVGTEGAMIDTLTRRIYRNAGSGAFTYGNDLKYPIPAE